MMPGEISGRDMPIITHALLYAGYVLVSLTVGLALSQVGGESMSSAFLGGLALFSACAVTHAGIAASAAAGKIGGVEKRLKGDMDRLRSAHREVIADIDAVTARLETLEHRVEAAPVSRQLAAPQPQSAPEIAMIEQIVDKLARSMDTRFEEIRRVSAPAAQASSPRGPMDLVREAILENRVELHLQPIVQLPQRRTAYL